MSKIKINFSQIKVCENELKDIFDIIENDVESLYILKNNKCIRSYGFDLLYSNLDKEISDLKERNLNISVLNKALSDIRQRYNLYEDKISQDMSIVDNISGESRVIRNINANSAVPQKNPDAAQNNSDGWNVKFGHLEGKFGLNSAKTKIFSSEKGLFANGEVKNKTSDIRNNRSVEFKILEGSASLVHAEKDWKNEYEEVSANVDMFKVNGEAGAKAQWLKGGKFDPFVGATIGAGAVVASGEVEGKWGNDDFNINGKAKAEVSGAEAKADVGIGKLENGGHGVKGEFKAEAYLARGEVKGGFEIFGLKIDATVGGKAGALGIGGGFEVVNNRVETKASVSALFGVDLKIGVDASGLFNNIGKFLFR